MTEVALVGATFYGNRGAEAMLTTTIALLRRRRPDMRFNVFSYYPVKDRASISDGHVRVFSATPAQLVLALLPLALLYVLLGIPGLRGLRRSLPESIQALARSKALICLAGVSFIDGREKFLPFNVATILPAMLVGVPVVKFAQAVGPFDKGANRLAARLFLTRCARVFTRGAVTHSHLADRFDGSFFERANDVAFSFRPEYSLTRGAEGVDAIVQRAEASRAGGAAVVGICPSVVVAKRRAAHGRDYADEVAALVTSLHGAGRAVVVFPNATRGDDPDKTHNNDLPLLADVRARLPDDVRSAVTVVDASVNAADVHRIIAACDVVVTSRFHAMVGALVCAKPVLVLGWSHKYREVMALFGLEDHVFDDSIAEVAALVHRVDDLIEHGADLSAGIARRLGAVQALASRQVDYVDGLLGRGT